MRTNPAIDIHAHALIPELDAVVAAMDGYRREAAQAAALTGAESVQHNRTLMQTGYMPGLTRADARIAAMDAARIDVQAVSIAPTLYYYWAERADAERIVGIANAGIAALCRSHPDRFVGLGTVAMQHPDLAVTQLEHAVTMLGLRGVIISTAINGRELADPAHEPFWAKAEALGALVFIHPMGCSLGARLTPFYFSNVIGNPAETTLALAHLVFRGVLDRHPRLKICAAHGGGYFASYIDRFDHGWRVRPEAHSCLHAPSEYLRRIWFDSIVYSPDALAYLVRRAGASQVVLGSDFPFDMGMSDPSAFLDSVAGLSDSDRAAIRGLNAAHLLGVPVKD